jgi:hypothetical protein
MSNKKSNRAKGQLENPRRRRKLFILVGILISLLLTSAALAQWAGIISVPNKSSGAIAPASLPAGAPSKVYIYGGGKLIATEEPSGGGCGGGLLPPTGLLATATSTTTINLTWNASAGAVAHYEVERKSNLATIVFNVAPGSPVNINDINLSPNTAYVYRVRAVDAASCPSSYGDPELATTTIFSESIVAGETLIKANPLIELRTAVNAVRATAGFGPFNWTNPAPAVGGNILKAHIQQLRDNLNPARDQLGLTQQPYTDPSLVAGTTLVKAAHIIDLRNGVK